MSTRSLGLSSLCKDTKHGSAIFSRNEQVGVNGVRFAVVKNFIVVSQLPHHNSLSLEISTLKLRRSHKQYHFPFRPSCIVIIVSFPPSHCVISAEKSTALHGLLLRINPTSSTLDSLLINAIKEDGSDEDADDEDIAYFLSALALILISIHPSSSHLDRE